MKQLIDILPKTMSLIEESKKESQRKNKIIFEIRKKYSVDDELAILR